MTISSASRKAGPFVGNSVATSFTFSFKVFATSDLVVTLSVIATGVDSTLVLDSDYTVTLNADQNNNPGGTVTYNPSGVPMPSTKKLTITSNVLQKQETDITNGGGFYPEVIESALDKATILIQQLSEIVNRTFRLPVSTSISAELPPPVGSQSFGWNAAGDAIINFTLQTGTSLVDLAASAGSALIGFIQAGVGAVLRTVQSKLRDWTFVEDWGASTSGTAAANTTAIQAAITACSLTGDVLHFSPGNYNINGALNFPPYTSLKGTHVIGAGGTTITQTDGTKNIFNFPDQATANDIQSVRLSDIVLSGGARQMYFPNGGVWVTLEHVTFSSPVEAGIYAKGFVQEWFCRDLDFINGDYGIYHVGAGTASIWEFDKCNFYSVYCHGQNINAIKHAIRDPVTVGVAGSATHNTWLDLRIVRPKQDGMVIGAACAGLTIMGFSTEGTGWTNGTPTKVYSTCTTTAASITIGVAELSGFVVGDQVTLQNCGEAYVGSPDEYDFVSTVVSKSAASGAGTMDLAAPVTRSRVGAVITNGQYADIKFLTSGGFVGSTSGVALINPQFAAAQSGGSLRYAVDGIYCANLTIENGVTAGGANAPVYGDPASVSGNITVRRTTWTEGQQESKLSNVPIGDVAYASLGTNAVHVAGTLYLAEIVLPKRFQVTGIGVLNGATVGTDKVIHGLYNASGNLVANTALAGVTTAGANAFQEIALTTPYKADAGRYYIVVQCNGTTDTTRRIAANTFIHSRTKTIAGVFGTLPNGQTMPTTIVADAGPIGYVY